MANHQDVDTALTCEIKDRISSDLEHRYIVTLVLKSACSWTNVLFFAPRFKDKYKLTDEPMQVLLQEGASILETESTDRVVSNLGQNEGESNEPLTKKRKGKFSSIFAATSLHSLKFHHCSGDSSISKMGYCKYISASHEFFLLLW